MAESTLPEWTRPYDFWREAGYEVDYYGIIVEKYLKGDLTGTEFVAREDELWVAGEVSTRKRLKIAQ